MSIVLPILGSIVLVAIAVGGVTLASRRGVSSMRIFAEILAVIVGGLLGPLPCACFALPAMLVSSPYGGTTISQDAVPLMGVALGSVIALCLVSRPVGRGAWLAAVVALVGLAAAAGASFGAAFLIQDSWCVYFLILVPVAIASATVGCYALALGPH
jgi:hypothetical protein